MDNSNTFNIVLRSESGKQHFANNKMTCFKVRLPKRLMLSPDWKVGLVDISFPNTLYTVSREETFYLVLEERKSTHPTEDDLPELRTELTFKPNAFDSVKAIVDNINTTVQESTSIAGDLPKIEVDSNGIVTRRDGKIGDRKLRLEFEGPPSGQLKNILGLERWGRAFINARHTNLYIYSDIVHPRIVGNVAVRLVRQIDARATSPFGSNVRHTYKDPHYCRLSKYTIDEVEILILDDSGKEPLFQFGEVILTLSFVYDPVMEDNEFTLVLPSNASMDIWPDNKLSHFKVRLPQRFVLSPDWKVGLTDISFTKSWFNLGPGNEIRIKSGNDSVIGKVNPGNYESPEQLVEELTRLVVGKWKKPQKPKFLIDPNSKKLKIEYDGDKSEKFEIEFSHELSNILGCSSFNLASEFNPSKPINLNQAYTNLFVYCDLVDPIIIGDTTGPLLRVVNARPLEHFGTHITETFDKPYYLPLAHTSFQEIEVYIRTDIGLPPHFNFGRVVVTLHFRKE